MPERARTKDQHSRPKWAAPYAEHPRRNAVESSGSAAFCRSTGTVLFRMPTAAAQALALTPVIAALDEAISQLDDASEWKWACLGIRRHMVLSAGLPLVRVVEP